MTAAVSDGRSIHALRYSSDTKSPTLFYASGGAVDVRDAAVRFTPGDAAVLVLSEPLDEGPDGWVEIPEAHILHAAAGAARISKFEF